MGKVKTAFYCQNCGAQSPKWVGKCNSCGEWNTFIEELVTPALSESEALVANLTRKVSKPRILSDISLETSSRLALPDKELNKVLGGGLVPGSVTLLGGEPGIGKSTLLLQLLLGLKNISTIYISGEESEQQIRMRAERIGRLHDHCFVLTETTTQNIFSQLKEIKPRLIVIDSIQTLFSSMLESSAGSVAQIRQCAAEMIKYSKENQAAVILIGHITKEGIIAGPKVLEHMVDTVLQFEGDSHHIYRLLRCGKNRFGSTSELGIYEMQGTGLKPVENPSGIMISHRDEPLSGMTIACTIEGMQPLLIEVQALASSAVYGVPQRSSTGFDLRRMNMLLAVLEKRCGFKLAAKDVFLNIAGGIKVEDPAIDLAVICSVLSSGEDIAIDPDCCFAGEVGLSGEIRPVNRIEQRIREAEKLGFEKMFISKHNYSALKNMIFGTIEIIPLSKVEDAFSRIFA